MKNIAGRACTAGVLAAFVLISGCAGGPDRNPADPFEAFNRKVQKFNDVVDDAVLKPTARTYVKVVPRLAREGVNNFFGNLADVWSAVNSFLQFKFGDSAQNIMRFNVNTVFGIGGLFDVATDAGIDRHPEDFGQTLGRWGVPPGPYLVLPLFGPSDIRDAAAFPVDRLGDPVSGINDTGTVIGLSFLRIIDLRAGLLRASRLIDDAALDPYSFTRDAYLQRRRNAVYDGRPPDPEE